MAELIDRRAPPSDTPAIVMAGGLSLIGGALAFLAVFSYLAAHFRYPEVLHGQAAEVLPALFATGDTGRAVWAIYSLLPIVFIPAGVASFCALRERAAGITRVGGLFALVAAISMMLGLMRWPSVHWELARSWIAAADSDRVAIAAVFNGLNVYLGNFIGEFLGELSLSIFFVLSGIGLLRHRQAPKLMGWWGIVTGVLGLVGLWRNVPGVDVSIFADMNNFLLPAWMIGFGVWLMLAARRLSKRV